jgi:hypothetical protein
MISTQWSKSSYSHDPEHSRCVEVAGLPVHNQLNVGIRDTENRHLGHLAMPSREWAGLLSTLRKME